MAADYKEIGQNLKRFYDFSGKTVLAVGAGWQLVDLAREARRLIVIDKDAAAIRQWEARVAGEGLKDRVEIIQGDFCAASPRGDVVYFEFSLHETDDPRQALRHALTLAPEVLIFDHWPDSEWVFHAAEEDKVRRSTEAWSEFGCVRRQAFRAEQRFQSYQQLVDKVACQGDIAVKRAERYRGASKIAIPMTYGLSLLSNEPRPSTAVR